ncbi:glycosyltransferase family 32 protein [Burkholderia gladioli]|uniref:glycosyltransferase family 32 protein n=1 Tax=Burkholderia gladioli TaxID=28095 RepID=UPI00163F8E61|nr:TcdA/TcdB catalytic glycosyltransferase domain-containing protein [Burkholderia gladioli]
MKAIPKQVHIIWIGGDIPARNRACIQTFVRQNPDWTINLWFDANQLLTGKRQAQVNAIASFCATNGIKLREVQRDLKMGKNAAIYQRELVDRGANFGAASDVLRIEILLQEGGLYVDTDVDCVAPLGSLICHQSYPRFSAVSHLWRNGISESEWKDDSWWARNFSGQTPPPVSNSIIASHAGCKGLKSYRQLINANFTSMRTSEQMQDLYFNDVRTSTIRMTGPSVASKSSGFEAARSATVTPKSGDAVTQFSDERKLEMRDHWYFPMYCVQDKYFHDWLQ